MQPTEEVEHVGLLRRTDLYIYIVDAPKCTGLNETFVEKLRGAVRSVHLERYRGGPAREEQSAYFKFLVDHYDDLPDFTIFVHPDAPEHQGEEFEAALGVGSERLPSEVDQGRRPEVHSEGRLGIAPKLARRARIWANFGLARLRATLREFMRPRDDL